MKILLNTAIETVLKPTAKAMVQEGRSFCGILYAGLISTEAGPKVIEFNARFGDPETQVILPRMKSDFVDVIEQFWMVKKLKLVGMSKAMIGVVVAANGYPEEYEKGAILQGLDDVSKELFVFHAGTKKGTSVNLKQMAVEFC